MQQMYIIFVKLSSFTGCFLDVAGSFVGICLPNWHFKVFTPTDKSFGTAFANY